MAKAPVKKIAKKVSKGLPIGMSEVDDLPNKKVTKGKKK